MSKREQEDGLHYPRPNNFVDVLDRLGISRTDVSFRGGHSHSLMSKIAKGYQPTRRTRKKIVKAINSLRTERLQGAKLNHDTAMIELLSIAVHESDIWPNDFPAIPGDDRPAQEQ